MATKREKELMKTLAEAARMAARGDPRAGPVPTDGHEDIDHLGLALSELMEALRSTREQYTLVTDKISDVIWIMDMDLNFTYMSPSTERMHGRKPLEWLTMTLEDAVPPSSLKTALHVLAEELSLQRLPGADTTRVRTLELEQYRKDGSTFWTEVAASFMWGDSPEPIGIIGVTRDISERKLAEETLRESEELFRTLFNTAPFTCAVTDPDGRFLMVNEAYLAKNGFTRDQVIGRTIRELGIVIDPAALESLNRERMRTGRLDSVELRVIMPDGRTRDVLVSSRNISLSGQECTLSVSVDITARKEAEQEWKKLTAILESTIDLVATATPEGAITYLNAAGRRMLGWDTPMDAQRQVLFSAHPAWAQRVVGDEAIPTAIERGVWQGETAVLGRDGREIPVSQVIMAHRSPEGELLYLSTIMRDLTEYKRSEEALRESASTYRNMVTNSPVGMHFYRLEEDGRLVLEDANPAADHILGIVHVQLLGKDILEAFPRLAGTEVPERYREAAAQGSTWETEQIFYEDERISGAFMVRAFRTKPGHMVAEFVDITARKRAELELKESEERFRVLHNASFGGIGIHEKGVILDCNQGLADITGYTTEDLVGMNGLNLIAPEWREYVMEKIVSGYDRAYEVMGLRRDGSTYPLEIHGKNIPYHGRTVRVTEFRDVTDRKKAEETIREREEMISALVETSRDWIWVMNRDGVHTFSNPAVKTILGYEVQEIIGRSLDLMHPDDREAVERAMPEWISEKRGWHNVLVRFRHRDGTWRYLESSSVPILDPSGEFMGFRGVDRDVTERMMAEEEQQKLRDQLMQAQKMESVGQLAGGIAHDFNNMLMPIIGYAELLGDNMPPDDPRCSYIEQILRSAERSRDLVRQLLAFARKQTLEMKPLDLNRVIENFEKMLRRALHEDVSIRTHLFPGIGTIMADVGQIEQIILNLSVNAQDAMPGGGTLSIETVEVFLDSDYTRSHEGLVPGPYVLMSMSDTGTGMDEQTRDRLFEPFFTTKAPGKGTGLGLATVYGIVKQHGGHISVYSEPGTGTTFRVYFPLHGESYLPDTREKPQGRQLLGHETLLVVEDEDQVRDLIVGILKGYGYVVLEAPDGMTAQEVSASFPDDIALVITDVVLPDMNGKTLFEHLTTSREGLRALFMSGYTADVITHHGILDTGVNFIQKPFSLQGLAQKVREILEDRQGQ